MYETSEVVKEDCLHKKNANFKSIIKERNTFFQVILINF